MIRLISCLAFGRVVCVLRFGISFYCLLWWLLFVLGVLPWFSWLCWPRVQWRALLAQLLSLMSLCGSLLGLGGDGDFDDTCLVLNVDISFLGWGGLCEVSGYFSGTCSRAFLAKVVSVVYYHFLSCSIAVLLISWVSCVPSSMALSFTVFPASSLFVYMGDLHDEAFCFFLFYSGCSFFMFSRMVLAFRPCLMSLVPTWIITVFPFSASFSSCVAQNCVFSDIILTDLVMFQLFRVDFISGSILPVFESPTMIMVVFFYFFSGFIFHIFCFCVLFSLSFSSVWSRFLSVLFLC